MKLPHFVGVSAWTRLLCDNIGKAAAFSSNVLITGPSGTGKELIARAVHQHSARSKGSFVPVDCTSLTGELFASHLFGHVKGAFTGADHQRLGCFRVADNGTIFLDEIGELSFEMQSRLLRTIQERMVVPLGSDEAVPIDVRIIAATHRDLMADVQAGRFRLDLYYRLNVVSFKTVQLADRPEDIKPLAGHFLDRLVTEQGFPHKRLSREALKVLQRHDWPGNVRELQNVLERAAIFASGDEIGVEALPGEISAIVPENSGVLVTISAEPVQPARPIVGGDAARTGAAVAGYESWPTLADVQRDHISATLGRAFYNQSIAAKLLDIDRKSLSRKINRYSIDIPLGRRGRPRRDEPDELLLPQ
jgi:DNA-binding NtrC family response regulator